MQEMAAVPGGSLMEEMKQTSAFGGIVHTLKGKPVHQCCGCASERNVMTFFEGGIQSQNVDSHCCGLFTNTYLYVVPKHTIIGVDVDSKFMCCCTRSLVHFKIKTDPQAPRSIFGSDEHMFIKIAGRADTHVMFDYVYGSLAKTGIGEHAHNLAHLLANGLCQKADVHLDIMKQVGGTSSMERL